VILRWSVMSLNALLIDVVGVEILAGRVPEC